MKSIFWSQGQLFTGGVLRRGWDLWTFKMGHFMMVRMNDTLPKRRDLWNLDMENGALLGLRIFIEYNLQALCVMA